MSTQYLVHSSSEIREKKYFSLSPERNPFVETFFFLIVDSSRRSILECLAVSPDTSTPLRERKSGEIARMLGISTATTSEHLRLLAQAGLVASRQEGTSVYYRLHNQALMKAFQEFLCVLETEYSTRTHSEADRSSAPQRVKESLIQAVTIRPATLFDAEALVPLMEQVGSPTTASEMGQRLERLLSQDHYHTLVAVVQGQVVGIMGMCLGWQYEASAPDGHILALVVAHTYQRSRIGVRLVMEAEHWFQNHGAERIVVQSENTRHATRRFYEYLGYQATGVRFVKRIQQDAKENSTCIDVHEQDQSR